MCGRARWRKTLSNWRKYNWNWRRKKNPWAALVGKANEDFSFSYTNFTFIYVHMNDCDWPTHYILGCRWLVKKKKFHRPLLTQELGQLGQTQALILFTHIRPSWAYNKGKHVGTDPKQYLPGWVPFQSTHHHYRLPQNKHQVSNNPAHPCKLVCSRHTVYLRYCSSASQFACTLVRQKV